MARSVFEGLGRPCSRPLRGNRCGARRRARGGGLPAVRSADEQIDFYSTKLGPLVQLRELAEAEGRWAALRDDLTALYEPQEIAEYLVVTGKKA